MLLVADRKDAGSKLPSNTYRANGRALKSLREQAMMTLHELEEVSGVSYTTISRIENGVIASPRWGTLKPLAAALDCSPRDLVIYEDVSEKLSDDNVRKLGDTSRRHDERHEERRHKEDEGSGDSADTGDRTL